MRADFEVEEKWVGHAGQPSSYAGAVDVPLVVLGGTDDPVVPAVELARWAEATLGSCEKSLFPGGHFYLTEGGIAVVKLRAYPTRPYCAHVVHDAA